jgi:voltage-gated potassium channel Kch
MNRASLRERLRYAFDNSMSKGTIALIGWLTLISAGLIFGMALLVWGLHLAPAQSDGNGPGFAQVAWAAMLRTLDPGTMGSDTGSWSFLISMLAITLGGIFIISTLIGVLTSGIEAKIEELRKGRSRVIETGHTVILGWSPAVFTIVSELCIANESQRKSCIVILGEEDKIEMEDALRDRLESFRRTRVVCRTGSPIDVNDLDMVSVQTSRSIVVLAPEGEDADSQSIKTILAITNSPNRRAEPYHIVAEIHDPKNLEVARMVGRNEAELVLVGDLVSRITVQTCRQSGLSVVYNELLDFDGDEIYFKAEPSLVGRTFSESLFAYDDCSAIGLNQKNGGVRLNPPMDTRIEEGDEIILIAEDDSKIGTPMRREPAIDEQAIRYAPIIEPKPERTLILGWNWRVPSMINELEAYVAPGSVLTAVADVAEAEEEIARLCTGISRQMVGFEIGDTTDRRMLDKLEIHTYNHVILVCSDQLPPQEADARVLITLLHLRDIADRTGHPFSIVSEMLDLRDRALAEVTHPDDFIVSERLISLLLSQISENKYLNAVFTDLFDPEGSEVYLKPATYYVAAGQPVSFYTVVESARRRGEVAIGYRLKEHATDAKRGYGVVVNPDKPDLVTFGPQDKVVVVAEN